MVPLPPLLCMMACTIKEIFKYHYVRIMIVAVNHENDTCFGNGLVMGSADRLCYAGLVKTPEKLFKCKPGSLSDTLQASACVFPLFQISRGQKSHVAFLQFLPLGTGSIWVVLWQSVSGPLPLRSHKRQVTFSGPFLGVPSHLDYT